MGKVLPRSDARVIATMAFVGLLDERADGAQFRKAAPQFTAETGLAARERVALRETVLLGDKAVQRIRQHAAVFGVLEIHRDPLTVPGSSSR
ncbi:hypothetical protein AWB67_07560 [Caballeronia terrestris]|uniref:Uncharacterized protein n=1 Tax=Caballeronia terrestris TaxID=1226301 RepID=A0A158L5M1_9BURK|nr:hypothetical protein AWB67_07560 [Caballeronia terrestris]